MAVVDRKDPHIYPDLQEDAYSFYQPVWQFVVLSILTLGIYDIYWYYKNWKHLKAIQFSNFSPVLRTIGLLIPIVNFFIIYKAHKDYRYLIIEKGINRDIYPGLIVLVIAISFALTRLPDPYWLLCFIATIPLAIVQDILNELWDTVQVGKPRRTAWRGRQIFLIVVGTILWTFTIIGMLFPE